MTGLLRCKLAVSLYVAPHAMACKAPTSRIITTTSLGNKNKEEPPNSHSRVFSVLNCYSSSSSQYSGVIDKMESSSGSTTSSPAVVKLKPIEATPESFQEFGQVIEASPDGEEFGPADAQLDLSRGTPRFYIMHLEDRALKFSSITHHADVTQCLGSIGGHVWYLGVAKPSIVDPTEIKGTMGGDVIQSHCGHFHVPPSVDAVCAFRISGPKFLKLNRGTWHAGPLFKDNAMDFYNLELSNTNVVDHTTHYFRKKNNVVFVLNE